MACKSAEVIKLSQDCNIRHNTMAANDSRKVFRLWKKRNFLVEGAGFFKGLARLVTISLNLLRPRDQQAEIGSLAQFRDLGCFRSRQDPCS